MKRVHYSNRMLRKQDWVKFRGHIAWQSFFENNFADFSNVVQVKKKKKDFVQPLVAYPISNISYCSIWNLKREKVVWQIVLFFLMTLSTSQITIHNTDY